MQTKNIVDAIRKQKKYCRRRTQKNKNTADVSQPSAASPCPSVALRGQSPKKTRYLRIQGRIFRFDSMSHANFQLFIVFRVFEKRFWQPFADLINSKACIHEYQLLNFSDLKKVDKTFFKNTEYQSERKRIFLAK